MIPSVVCVGRRTPMLAESWTTCDSIRFHVLFPPGRWPIADVSQIAICQVVADACRHAGWNPFEIPHRNAGVYVGHTTGGKLGGELTYATCVAESAEYLRELAVFRQLGEKTGAVLKEIVRRLRAGTAVPNAPKATRC